MTIPNSKQSVFVVDDEPKVCEVICKTLEKAGVAVTTFNSGPECLDQLHLRKCDLLITDLKIPQMDGIELLTSARLIVPWLPVLMITGYGDIPMAVKAIRAGAVDFIEKPLNRDDFLRQVELLLEQSKWIDQCVSTPLTRSEARVLKLIVDGKSNKEIAELLCRSIRTIEVHRGRIMRKMGTENLVDLLKQIAAMGLIEFPIGFNRQKNAQGAGDSV